MESCPVQPSVWLVSWEVFVRKADKEKKKNTLSVWLHSIWIPWCSSESCCISVFFLCFCMSYATSFSVSSSNKKNKRNKNTEWTFSVGVFLNFQTFISTHNLLTSFLLMRQKRVGWAACTKAGVNARTWQVCAAHGVTWRLQGRIGPKQIKRCFNGSFY